MKKKIKLYAFEDGYMIGFTEDQSRVKARYRPEFDMEKEIEVADEPRKPREYWLTGDMFDRVLEAHTNKDSAYAKFKDVEKIHVIEKLPDHVVVSRKDIFDIVSRIRLDGITVYQVLKELGLGE